MSLTKQVTPSNEYAPETIRLMENCLRNQKSVLRAHMSDLYTSVCVRARGEFPLNHPSLVAIEEAVRGLANDADAIRDVCQSTHEYLCGVSKVYSYSEGVTTDREVYEVVAELVEDYINETLEANGKRYTEDNEFIEFYFEEAAQMYEVCVQ